MTFPPTILHLVVARPDGRPLRLWLPLFVLWPLALALGVLVLPIAIVADVVLLLLGRRPCHFTPLLVRVSALLVETRGTVIRIDGANQAFNLTLY